MKVSVIIPHYNAEAFLAEAVASVVLQGDIVQELIVVDDGSPEPRWFQAQETCIGPLKKAHESLDEVWVRNGENRGQGATLNYALLLARAELVAFLDADDVWTPGRLERMVKWIEERGVAGVYGYAQEFKHAPESERVLSDAVPAPLTSGLCVRRKVLSEYPFAEGTGAGMTIDWFARVTDAGLDLDRMPLVLFCRRIHGDNYGIRCREQALKEYTSAIRKIEERRRLAKTEPQSS